MQVLALLLAVGVNQSVDPGLTPLRYAEADAEKFAHAYRGAAHDETDLRVARSPSLVDFRATMDAAASQSRTRAAAGAPLESFVFYFSGHADDRGLHFRDGFLPRAELHAWLEQIKAGTKLIVIDACFSGSLASKGAELAPEFELPKLDLDRLTGTVYLTASSSRDVAFESDELGGSVFTHYLVAGLSGKADLNADSVVTVEELYQFTYREMQLRNLAMPSGRAQKPEIHVDLHGSGAMVVARPRASQGNLLVDPGILGTIQLGSVSGIGSFSIYSGGTKPTEVLLPAGQYRALIRRGNRVGEARVEIARTGGARLLAGDFSWHDIGSTPGLTKGSPYALGSVSALVGFRLAADRTGSAGPELELANELGIMPGTTYTARPVALFSMRQLHGETSDERLDSFASAMGLGVQLSPTPSAHQRLLIAANATAEWQEWESSEGLVAQTFTTHPTLTFGLAIDMTDERDSNELALRYDSDYVAAPKDDRVRRRDSYLLGIGFKP